LIKKVVVMPSILLQIFLHKDLKLKKFLLEMRKEISKSIGNVLCFQI
jgi:hypothetical protein